MEVYTHKQYPQYFPLITGKGGGKGIICFLDKISIRMISDLFFAGWSGTKCHPFILYACAAQLCFQRN